MHENFYIFKSETELNQSFVSFYYLDYYLKNLIAYGDYITEYCVCRDKHYAGGNWI